MKLLLMNSFYLCAWLFSASIILCTSQLQAKSKKQYFNRLQLDTGLTITHQIEVANFIEGTGNEVFVLGVNKDGINKAFIFEIDLIKQTYKLLRDITIPYKTVAYDFVTDIHNTEKMLLLNETTLSVLNFNNREITTVLDVSSIYLNPNPQYIIKKDLVSDFNNDQLDDIYISDFTKTHFLLQQNTGQFDAFSLPVRSIVDMNNNHMSFSETKIFSLDSNFDLKNDIVIVGENKLIIYEQLSSFNFSKVATVKELPMKVSALPWWLLRTSDGETVDQSTLQHSMLEVLEDINNDNLPDIMVRLTSSTGVFDRENIYEIYYATNNNGILTYNAKADTSITASGTLSGLKLLKAYSDDRKEILVSSFEIGITQIIGALLSGSIDQNVYIFKLDDNNQFNKKPLFSKDVELSFSLSSGSTGQPVIIPLNLKGNSDKEILLSNGNNRLVIYEYDNGKHKYNKLTYKDKLVLPKNGEMVISADYNNDDIDEIYIRYGKQDEEHLRSQLKILSNE